MGLISGSIPWYTMMVLHRRSAFFQSVDDTLGVFHTHAVAGFLGGLLSGILAKPRLLRMMYHTTPNKYKPGLIYGLFGNDNAFESLRQVGYQLVGAVFITLWNVVVTSLICIVISRFIDLRMDEDDLEIGDDAVHGEEAYALWGDGEKLLPNTHRLQLPPKLPFLAAKCDTICRRLFDNRSQRTNKFTDNVV